MNLTKRIESQFPLPPFREDVDLVNLTKRIERRIGISMEAAAIG